MAPSQPILGMRRAFTWLIMRGGDPVRDGMLDPSIETLLNELDNAVQRLDRARVWRIIKRLVWIGDPSKNNNDGIVYSERTFGYIHLRCALAYYDMGHLGASKDALSTTIAKYKSAAKYEEALALWMRGYVRWQMLDGHDEATVDWQRCISMFRDLRKSTGDSFYQDCLDEMTRSLKRCIELDGLPAQNPMAVPLWQVFENVPQGTKKINELYIPNAPRVRANQFWINQQLCVLEVFDPAPEFLYNDAHKVVRVEDDSIKAAYIFRDDYVLVQEPPAQLSRGQLVLVAFDDLNKTVVRYYFPVQDKDAKDVIEFRTNLTGSSSGNTYPPGSAAYQVLGSIIGVFRPERCTRY